MVLAGYYVESVINDVQLGDKIQEDKKRFTYNQIFGVPLLFSKLLKAVGENSADIQDLGLGLE